MRMRALKADVIPQRVVDTASEGTLDFRRSFCRLHIDIARAHTRTRTGVWRSCPPACPRVCRPPVGDGRLARHRNTTPATTTPTRRSSARAGRYSHACTHAFRLKCLRLLSTAYSSVALPMTCCDDSTTVARARILSKTPASAAVDTCRPPDASKASPYGRSLV